MTPILEILKHHISKNKDGFIKRLESRIVKVNGCWEFCGARKTGGYTSLNFRYSKRHYQIKAHRLMWVLVNCRDIPEGMEVDHICYSPACINPAHLRLLTPTENKAFRRVLFGRPISLNVECDYE